MGVALEGVDGTGGGKGPLHLSEPGDDSVTGREGEREGQCDAVLGLEARSQDRAELITDRVAPYLEGTAAADARTGLGGGRERHSEDGEVHESTCRGEASVIVDMFTATS